MRATLLVLLLAPLMACPPPGGGSTSTTSSSGGGKTPGAVGEACDSASPCGSHLGTQLECVANICEVPGCPSGALGCPCRGGMCDEAGSACQDNVCAAAGCTAGTPGCTCASGNTCEQDAQCVRNFCRYPTRLGISVRTDSVRACDLLLQEGTRSISRVTFPASVVGEFSRRAPRTAISFTRKANAGSTGTAITLEFTGTEPVTPQDVTLVETRCFGPTGAAVDNPGVTIE